MEQVKIALVCDRESYEDTTYGTGLVWAGKGDVKSVPADKWALMAKHTDVWLLVESKAAELGLAEAKPAELVAEAATNLPPEPASTTPDLDAMDDAALRDFAAEKTIKVHHKQTGDTLRAVIRKALG